MSVAASLKKLPIALTADITVSLIPAKLVAKATHNAITQAITSPTGHIITHTAVANAHKIGVNIAMPETSHKKAVVSHTIVAVSSGFFCAN